MREGGGVRERQNNRERSKREIGGEGQRSWEVASRLRNCVGITRYYTERN